MNLPIIDTLDVTQVPRGTIQRYWLNIIEDGMGIPVQVPILVARGMEDGEVVGLTAAVHGNELNGIPVIQRLFQEINVKELKGTIVGVPVVNVPSFARKKRRFLDGVDLNHIMPGKADGKVSQLYAWRVVERIIKQFDFLLDLHTASVGRINSYYVRADMNVPTVRKMALLQNAQIIVHNPPNDGTLRGTAADLGIAAITMEVGDPNLFQKGMIREGLTGIYNLLGYLDMVEVEVEEHSEETIICDRSFWMYVDAGGLLTVHPDAVEFVKKGDKVATLRNVFGDVIKTYQTPEDGVVIGKSVSPVNQSGGRILHLGRVMKED